MPQEYRAVAFNSEVTADRASVSRTPALSVLNSFNRIDKLMNIHDEND